MGSTFKALLWKYRPFGWHILICLNMWAPPPPVWITSFLSLCSSSRGAKQYSSIHMFYLAQKFESAKTNRNIPTWRSECCRYCLSRSTGRKSRWLFLISTSFYWKNTFDFSISYLTKSLVWSVIQLVPPCLHHVVSLSFLSKHRISTCQNVS